MAMLQAAMMQHLDFLVASMAALSIFLACLLVFWPYLVKDGLGHARYTSYALFDSAVRTR